MMDFKHLTTKAFFECTRTGTAIKFHRHKWSQFCMTKLLECFIEFLSVSTLIGGSSKGISIKLEDAHGVTIFMTMNQDTLEQLKQDTCFPGCINIFVFDLGTTSYCDLMKRGSHLVRASEYIDCSQPYFNLDVSVVLVVKDLIFDDYDILLLFLMSGRRTLGNGLFDKREEWTNFHIMTENLVDNRKVNLEFESIESIIFNRFSWLFLKRTESSTRRNQGI